MKTERPNSHLMRVTTTLSLLLFCITSLFAQDFTATGIVNDHKGLPMVGVTVIVTGTQIGVVTNVKGEFSIKTPNKESGLNFSSLGYLSVSAKATANMLITMQEDTQTLDEVVVIGYGVMRKRDVTGTISSVGSKDIVAIPVSSAAEALTGKVAGVRVVTKDGEPGADIDITVRGGTSITQDNSPLYVIDGFVSDLGLKGIDPNDIENIDILKDASTTAIYGSRGANGVILVTTKRGKKGRTSVSYNGYVGFRQLPNKYNVLQPVDFVKLQYEMAARTESASPLEAFTTNYGTYADIEKNFSNRGLDWQDIMFGNNAVYHSHNISLTGGGDKHSFMASYSNNSEKGILMNTDNQRNTFRLKFDQELFKGVLFRSNVSYYINQKNGDITAGSTLDKTLRYRPVANVDASDDELIDQLEDPIGNSIQNPRASQLSQLRYSTDKSLNINANIIAKFLNDKFTLNVSGSGTWSNSRSDSFDDKTSSAATSKGGPFGSQKYGESSRWQNSNTLTYANTFKKHHRLNLMVGNELVFGNSRSLLTSNTKFPDDNFGIFDMGLGTSPAKPKSDFDENGLVSYFARAFYNYNDRYMVTLSGRYDGSNKFERKNRFAFFPSVSGAWVISQERWMQSTSHVLNSLKLRLSYGMAGNDRIGNNRYLSTFESNWYTDGSSEMPGLITKSLGNPNLKWETTTSANIGLDFGFFRNRISGSLEFYRNNTKDLLLTANIPPTTGFTKQTLNIGAVRGQGAEVTINTVNISKKNFSWTSSLNISISRNKVTALNGENEYMLFKSGVGSYMEDYMVRVGYSTGLIYGYLNDGLYGVDDFDAVQNTATGNWKYTLKDGTPFCSITGVKENVQPGSPKFKSLTGQSSITDADRTIIGNANPKHFGGFNNSFTYRNIDLAVFMNWSYGNDVLNYQRARLTSTYQLNQNQHADLNNRFTYIDNQGTYITEPNALRELNKNATMHAVKTNGPESNITVTQSDFVEDGSFLRINNITLGYSFKPELLKKIRLSSLRIYATMNNVYTFTKYTGFDPEVNKHSNGGLTPGVDWSAYPKTRSIVFGINITF